MVDVAPAKPDVERAGERGLDNAGIGAWMLAGVAAYDADRPSGTATDQRRPGCRCQRRQTCRNPVEEVIEAGRLRELGIEVQEIPG